MSFFRIVRTIPFFHSLRKISDSQDFRISRSSSSTKTRGVVGNSFAERLSQRLYFENKRLTIDRQNEVWANICKAVSRFSESLQSQTILKTSHSYTIDFSAFLRMFYFEKLVKYIFCIEVPIFDYLITGQSLYVFCELKKLEHDSRSKQSWQVIFTISITTFLYFECSSFRTIDLN